MPSLIIAYLLGMLTILGIMLLLAVLDWLKDRIAATHYGGPPPSSSPPRPPQD